MNIFDYIENKIMNIIKSLGLILLYICWNLFIVVIMKIFKFKLTNISDFDKLIISLVSDITFFILIVFIYRKKLVKDFKNYFNKDVENHIGESIKYWGIGFLIMIISNFVIYVVMNGKLANNEEAVRNMIKLSPVIMAFEVSIYAPIVEELLFRENIRKITDNKYLYPLLSGLIFGGLHVITSVSGWVSLLYLIPYSALGITFALLYKKTDNIFSSIVVHSFHNTLALLLLVGKL